MTLFELISRITSGELDDQLKKLYGSSERNIMKNRARYLSAAENFSRLYPECDEIRVFSVGGAFEISGGWTEAQNGKILAASVNADIIAIAALNNEDKMNFAFDKSEKFTIDTGNLPENEKDIKAAAVAEIIRIFEGNGIACGGLDVYISSEIPEMAGESAAFEVISAMIINGFFGENRFNAAELVEILNESDVNSRCIDRAVCANGGIILADFVDSNTAEMNKIGFDFSGTGYSLCVTSTGDMASELLSENTTEKMSSIAKELGCTAIGDVDESEFYSNIHLLRDKFSDKDVLNAVYFLDEIKYTAESAEALEYGDTDSFFNCVSRAGENMVRILQNSDCLSDKAVQSLLLANAVGRKFTDGIGAVRICKNGAGDFVAAFMPYYLADEYQTKMNEIFGKSSCQQYGIRNAGCFEFG